MENSTVKRGIGVVVLAIIAVVLLSMLVNNKSEQRQDIVDLKLPGSPDINIPNLSESATEAEEGSAAILMTTPTTEANNTGDKVVDSASAIISSAGTAAISNTSETVKAVTAETGNDVANANRGFSFRPAMKNEEKHSNNTVSANTKPLNDSSSADISIPKVIASSKSFKPVIEKEKKKVAKHQKKKTKKSTAKPAKQKIAKKAKTAPAKKNITKKSSAPKKTIAKKSAPKQQATPKKQTKVAAVNAGKYSIQLLATSSQSRATKLANTMSGEGYKSFITRTKNNNKILYRVRIGSHTNRNSAIKAQGNLKKRYQKNFFVQNSLVISN